TGGNGTGGNDSDCTEITATGSFVMDRGWYYSEFTPNADGSEIAVLFYAPDTGTFDLAAAPNDNFETCDQCVLVVPSTENGKLFYQASGTAEISSYDQNSGQVEAKLTDVKLVEVT